MAAIILLTSSCEEPFTPTDVSPKYEYVVEGKIELSDIQIPAYVILSKSFSYFDKIDSSTFGNIYIDDADISVSDGEKEVNLDYVCIRDLDPITQLRLLSDMATKLLDPNFCLYIDKENKLVKDTGRSYVLNIKHDGNVITSTTSIKPRVVLDSTFFKSPPGTPIDTMKMLWGRLNDPADEINYYKYFAINPSKLYSSNSNTLYDDKLINGKSLDLPFPKPFDRNSENIDPETANLYLKGDTIIFKWCTLDEAGYNYWESYQFSNNQGPFSSYIRPTDNIDGGIGNWGGYNCQVYFLVVD